MIPPAAPVSFKPLPQKSNNRDHPHTIPLSHSQGHFNLGKPQDNSEIDMNTRLDKRPSEILLIQRPDSHGQSSGQGHVHTEILVHHRPETVNIRPQAILHSHSHGYQDSHEPPRRDYPNKHSRPSEQLPPRRTEIGSRPTEPPHQYIYLENKPNDAATDIKLNWQFDRKSQRNPSDGRPERRPERPSHRPHQPTSHSYPIFERPGSYPGRKPQYQSPPNRQNPQGTSHFLNKPNWHSQAPHESPKKPISQSIPVSSYPQEQHTHPTNLVNSADKSPTEVIGYYNPSTDPQVKPVDTRYYPQLPVTNTEVQSFGEILPHEDSHEISWQIDTQTERTSADSESDASENIKFHNEPQDHHHHQNGHGQIDKQDEEMDDVQTASSYIPPESEEIPTKNSYDTIGAVNTVVGKPLDIQQSMNYENQNKNPLNFGQQHNQDNSGHSQTSYNSGSYENPIVQGKPYNVYNSQGDGNRSQIQIDEDSDRPNYEVIQGVPFSQHGASRPAQEQRPAARPHDRDDTTDLKPPAITPQYGQAAKRPGRPFSRPHGQSKPETRPGSRPRPEHDGIRVDSSKNRPGNNRDQSGNSEGHVRPSSQQISEENTYPRPEWDQGSQNSDNGHSQGHTRPDYRDQYENSDNRRNQTKSDSSQESSYFPVNTEETKKHDKTDYPTVGTQNYGTRVHPAYPHILTKPRPRVPGPVTISSGSKKQNANGRPKIQFSLPVEATGEEKDSKTQTERPPSMLVTANSQQNKKQKEETLETAFQTNFAAPDTDNDDIVHDVKVNGKPMEPKRPKEESESGKPKVPSQNMMPPPMRKSGNVAEQSDKDKNEDGLKPPPLPSDVVGLSPPPVAITTTGRPKEDRFPYVTADETGLRPPPKYIPLNKDSIRTVTLPQPSTNMVPPSPRPTVAKPFLMDLLSQVIINTMMHFFLLLF